jgi:hypothetical protein
MAPVHRANTTAMGFLGNTPFDLLIPSNNLDL